MPEPAPCPTCKGRGHVPAKKPDGSLSDQVSEHCAACKGTGCEGGVKPTPKENP